MKIFPMVSGKGVGKGKVEQGRDLSLSVRSAMIKRSVLKFSYFTSSVFVVVVTVVGGGEGGVVVVRYATLPDFCLV